jgi:hypothetical protein
VTVTGIAFRPGVRHGGTADVTVCSPNRGAISGSELATVSLRTTTVLLSTRTRASRWLMRRRVGVPGSMTPGTILFFQQQVSNSVTGVGFHLIIIIIIIISMDLPRK